MMLPVRDMKMGQRFKDELGRVWVKCGITRAHRVSDSCEHAYFDDDSRKFELL